MSTEQRNQFNDIAKWILWISLSISSFLIANTYNKVDEKMNRISEKMESMEARIIRIEYEVKLK